MPAPRAKSRNPSEEAGVGMGPYMGYATAMLDVLAVDIAKLTPTYDLNPPRRNQQICKYLLGRSSHSAKQ